MECQTPISTLYWNNYEDAWYVSIMENLEFFHPDHKHKAASFFNFFRNRVSDPPIEFAKKNLLIASSSTGTYTPATNAAKTSGLPVNFSELADSEKEIGSYEYNLCCDKLAAFCTCPSPKTWEVFSDVIWVDPDTHYTEDAICNVCKYYLSPACLPLRVKLRNTHFQSSSPTTTKLIDGCEDFKQSAISNLMYGQKELDDIIDGIEVHDDDDIN